MNERWVCKQCFADNDGSAASCVRCGQQRNAELSQPETGWTPAAAAAQPEQSEGLRRYARFAWVPVLAVVLVIGYLAASGQRALEDLAVGHCFNAPDGEEISEIERTDCDEPHAFEVVHVVDWPLSDDVYPTVFEQNHFLSQECVPAFDAYVGKAFFDSELDLYLLTPSEQSWSDGDREFVCSAYDPVGRTLTASVKDSRR